MHKEIRARLAEKFAETRNLTLQIFSLADEAVLRESPGFGFRPILWHLAHIGAFEEYWLLNRIAGENPINSQFQIIFDPIKTPREQSKNLPLKTEMLAFLDRVRDGARRVLETADFADQNPLLKNAYIFNLVLQHELQHQETLAYLFHLLPHEKVQSPNSKVQTPKSQRTTNNEQRTFFYDSGELNIGAENLGEFVYDNEIPRHSRFIPAFRLERFLTTNAEFAEFIGERGYERQEFWSETGWQIREKENWQHPLYWKRAGTDWLIRTFSEEKSLREAADFPVYGVSFYEAEAYASFRKKRLPTEFEWECAASLNSIPDGENCNFGFRFWNATPVNNFEQSGGISDLSGNLWEWTSSDFAGYPNFEPFPYSEYSAEWFDGDHKVLRGGSWATSEEILRPTFRNFFRRPSRLAFAGIRLAETV